MRDTEKIRRELAKKLVAISEVIRPQREERVGHTETITERMRDLAESAAEDRHND